MSDEPGTGNSARPLARTTGAVSGRIAETKRHLLKTSLLSIMSYVKLSDHKRNKGLLTLTGCAKQDAVLDKD